MERGAAQAALLLAGALFWTALPGSRPPRPASPRPLPGGAAGLLFGRRLDLNRASPEALETLPGIGPARARAIAAARVRHAFCSVGELARVPGIGPVTVRRLRPWLEVGRPPQCPEAPGRAD